MFKFKFIALWKLQGSDGAQASRQAEFHLENLNTTTSKPSPTFARSSFYRDNFGCDPSHGTLGPVVPCHPWAAGSESYPSSSESRDPDAANPTCHHHDDHDDRPGGERRRSEESQNPRLVVQTASVRARWRYACDFAVRSRADHGHVPADLRIPPCSLALSLWYQHTHRVSTGAD